MPVTLGWDDVALRLALSVFAGGMFGLDRSILDKPAGLRTAVLVCLAAAVSMILANLLLSTTGRDPQSFVSFDVMRLPLGVLTGMGFIGAGAIVRKGNYVHGVTTAATLWLTTLVGLCLGGGQYGLGLAALALGVLTLVVLKRVEGRMPHERRATLVIVCGGDGPADREVRAALAAEGYRVSAWRTDYKARRGARRRTIRCEVRWRGLESDEAAPAYLDRLARLPGVRAVRWRA